MGSGTLRERSSFANDCILFLFAQFPDFFRTLAKSASDHDLSRESFHWMPSLNGNMGKPLITSQLM